MTLLICVQTSSKHMFDYQHRLQHRQWPQTATQEDTNTSATPLPSRLTATRPPRPPIPRARTTTTSWSRKRAQKGKGRTSGKKGRGMGTGLETRLVSSPWYVSFPFIWTTTDIFFCLQLGLPDNYLRRLQRRYRAQTTRIASFGPLVSFLLLLFVIFFILTMILYRFSSARNRRDPIDGYTVVWAPVSSPHTTTTPYPHHTLTTNTSSSSSSSSNRNSWDSRAAEKRGSRRVASWAPGTFLFFFFSFYYTNFYFYLDLRLYCEGYSNDIGPKRLRIASFGPLVSIFFFIHWILYIYLLHLFTGFRMYQHHTNTTNTSSSRRSRNSWGSRTAGGI